MCNWSVLNRCSPGKRSEEFSSADRSPRLGLCTALLAPSTCPRTRAGRLSAFLAGLSRGLDRNVPPIQQPGLHVELLVIHFGTARFSVATSLQPSKPKWPVKLGISSHIVMPVLGDRQPPRLQSYLQGDTASRVCFCCFHPNAPPLPPSPLELPAVASSGF